ncbi:hypothetical protein A8C56_18550 [Niabella ginsenosidivorans]|uniref:Uncharacterized protein n=1 Tax=Niabella ginsenosidivorans TaxID=1176587 RepID=A0A1A9I7M6_9BACT|nr:hypothetical protein A8C56_18550 [Niabella ginsenosidivorans]
MLYMGGVYARLKVIEQEDGGKSIGANQRVPFVMLNLFQHLKWRLIVCPFVGCCAPALRRLQKL